MRHIVLALAVLFLLASTLSAQPRNEADVKAASKKAWKQGAADYEAGRYDRAITRFKESYQLAPSPSTLFSLGQAYRKKGDAGNALDCFRRYLNDRVDAPNRELVEELIRELEEANPSLKLATAAPATTSTASASSSPGAHPVEPAPITAAPPPPPPIAAAPPGGTQAGAVPILMRDEPPGRRWTSDPLGLTLAGVGIVATGVGIGLLVHSAGVASGADATTDENDAMDKQSSARTLRVVGGVTTAVGVAALGAGLVKLFVLDRRAPRRAEVAHHGRGKDLSWSAGPGWIVVGGSF